MSAYLPVLFRPVDRNYKEWPALMELVEVSYEGEADLHKHLNSCDKNPGHQNFVPVDQFSMEHLPSDYRNNELLGLIRALSDLLTVRMSVKYVSDRRPKTWPGSDVPYPFCDDSHSRVLRTGTGCVQFVKKQNEQYGCPSSSPKFSCACISIQTAVHVVYDDLEGQHTTFHLFFDKDGTPDVCPNVVTVAEISSTKANTEQDLCMLNCVTHDLDLADRLEKNLEHYEALEKKVCLWYQRDRPSPPDSVLNPKKVLSVIVSHPHGCSKQITVGYCTSRAMDDKAESSYLTYTYTTPTYPGYSGAHALLLGNVYNEHQHIHIESNEGNKELYHTPSRRDLFYAVVINNMHQKTGKSYKILQDCYMSSDLSVVDTGAVSREEQWKHEPWEVEISYREADLHRHYSCCEKNPNHTKFIPVDKFNMDHLPPSYRDSDLVDLIRAIADITVRVSVKCVSDKRPETFPETNKPFPHFRDGPRNLVRTGTGWVYKVHRIVVDDDTCQCEMCSQKNKTQSAKILIHTSNHVVFDELEGYHTTCHLFFDRGGSPEFCDNVITLSRMSEVKNDFTFEKSELIFITHDLKLIDKLDKMVEDFYDLSNKYQLKQKDNNAKTLPSSETEPMLIVIVSHPHGCSKQISIGHCESSDKDCSVWTRYTYTTATCPGSSGARVFMVRKYWWWWWWSDPVHSGNCPRNGEQLNYSGPGL